MRGATDTRERREKRRKEWRKGANMMGRGRRRGRERIRREIMADNIKKRKIRLKEASLVEGKK